MGHKDARQPCIHFEDFNHSDFVTSSCGMYKVLYLLLLLLMWVVGNEIMNAAHWERVNGKLLLTELLISYWYKMFSALFEQFNQNICANSFFTDLFRSDLFWRTESCTSGGATVWRPVEISSELQKLLWKPTTYCLWCSYTAAWINCSPYVHCVVFLVDVITK